jgi:hypothetical protein
VGAGGVVAMGALTMVFAGTEAHASAPTIATEVTITGAGQTSTQAPDPPPAAATSLATPAATPTLKSSPWSGGGWPGFK